jgi:hypothetical protein
MDREFFDKPVPAADPRLFEILRGYLEHTLSRMPREDEILAGIRRAIAESMREGQPRLSRIAKLLARSSRTLQRLLELTGNFQGHGRRYTPPVCSGLLAKQREYSD